MDGMHNIYLLPIVLFRIATDKILLLLLFLPIVMQIDIDTENP